MTNLHAHSDREGERKARPPGARAPRARALQCRLAISPLRVLFGERERDAAQAEGAGAPCQQVVCPRRGDLLQKVRVALLRWLRGCVWWRPPPPLPKHPKRAWRAAQSWRHGHAGCGSPGLVSWDGVAGKCCGAGPHCWRPPLPPLSFPSPNLSPPSPRCCARAPAGPRETRTTTWCT